MNEKDIIGLQKKFTEYFGESITEMRYFFAPGRVNLIGEHIDYNGGYVFPAALTIGITALIRPNHSDTIRMHSLNAKGEVTVKLDEEIRYKENDWGNYPKGVFCYLIKEGYKLKGCDILFFSSLPDGAGLSSSAAIEVLTTFMMLKLSGIEKINRVWIATFCQRVENEFVRVNCGIMDQFSIAMGKKNSAILLDCDTLKYEYVPLKLEDYSFVIMNTNKKRELADSKYNERRNECEKILRIINLNEKPVKTLCEVALEHIDKHIKDDILKRRAHHVVTENQRVLEAINALDRADILCFASLLTISHYSLKHDYEVTGFELDTMVEEALKVKGCLGARMTGAGFGGCAIALVKTDSIPVFINTVYKAYKEKTNIEPAFYDTNIGNGVDEFLINQTIDYKHYKG
jgi:galactokinase